jgi:hypothetical protein
MIVRPRLEGGAYLHVGYAALGCFVQSPPRTAISFWGDIDTTGRGRAATFLEMLKIRRCICRDLGSLGRRENLGLTPETMLAMPKTAEPPFSVGRAGLRCCWWVGPWTA